MRKIIAFTRSQEGFHSLEGRNTEKDTSLLQEKKKGYHEMRFDPWSG
jgi:hypothetical protein